MENVSIQVRLYYMHDDPFKIIDERKEFCFSSGTAMLFVYMERIIVHDLPQLAFLAIS
jgi:hypothetical protein